MAAQAAAATPAAATAEGIRFERNGRLGVVVLDRQRSLNALTRDMIQAFSLRLLDWREDPDVAAVVVKAAPGRAFCAGGDVREIWDMLAAERVEDAIGFFREEYRLDWRVFRYPKPFVALIDGIVMGGGTGISVHGSHRVMGEGALFAMPETGLGFFPDVGGTYFLPRCPGEVGTYLGLTGSRIGVADCLYAGIATQFVPGDRHARLEEALSTLPSGCGAAEVDAVVGSFAAPPPGEPPLAGLRETIDSSFAGESLAGVLDALGRDPEGFGAAILGQLREKSPLSLRVTFEQLRKGGGLTFEEAMQLEFRLASRFMQAGEMSEGVRAVLIDRDRQPRWGFPDPAAVPQEVVDAYFASLDGAELTFDWQGL